MVNSLINRNGKNVLLYRGYTETSELSSTQYLPPTQFKVGINNETPLLTNTELKTTIPILNGVIMDNLSTNLTGVYGGDNSTDNTSIFKVGGGETDDTAQNLIANDTNTLKEWGKDTTNYFDINKPVCLWLYVTQNVIDKIDDAFGYGFQFLFESSHGVKHRLRIAKADLVVGWNYINTGTMPIGDLTEVLSITGYRFEIRTNTINDTDDWGENELVIDLIRQYEDSDLVKDFVAEYPIINYDNSEVLIKCKLLDVEANGFLINGLAIFNEDDLPLMLSEDTYIGESKTPSDEFTFIVKDRLI